MRALVIGGGVSGLTTALVLLEAGWQVSVWAREWVPHIVSSVAAAIWHPYQVAHPDASRWAMQSQRRLHALAQQPESGVRSVVGIQYYRAPTEPPDWANALPYYRALPPEDLPSGFVCGYCFEVPLIETPVYMPWLREQVAQRGGQLVQHTVASLDEVVGEWPVVVNCTGLGARELVADAQMVPIRGQIVKVAPGAVDHFLFDEDDPDQPIYLIPRRDGIIVGGTALHDDWDLAVRPETTERILSRAQRLVPALADAATLDVLVGLRPGRSSVRLEAERRGESLVLHNYGHGGSGFTLSWGCAEDVAALAAGQG